MPGKWVSVVVGGFLVVSLTACGGEKPTTQQTPSSQSPVAAVSTLSCNDANARKCADDKEVQDTGCDKPTPEDVFPAPSGIRLGKYQAKLQLRISTNSEERCKNLVWLLLTPITPPDENFAAVLQMATGREMVEVTRQAARPSDPTVQMITKGRVVQKGQEIQGCLVDLLAPGGSQSNFGCTDTHKVL